ncbi:MAG: divergent polysaccharide deacetylase family protein [Smithellaceae bacterium]
MKKKKKNQIVKAALIALIVLSVAAIVYVLQFKEEPMPQAKPPVTQPSVDRPVLEKEKPAVPVEKEKPEKEKVVVSKIEKKPLPKPTRRVAIIIDDIGYDMTAVKNLIAIDADITFAILPHITYSRRAADMLHQAGRETLLHLPMEPASYPKAKPGEGALFTDMNEAELIHQMEKNFASVPHVSGVNNHMGSKFMSDEEKLTLVFRELKKRNMFFIDSRTTPQSKTAAALRTVDVPIGSRTVFLDNERDYNRIYRILMEVANAGDRGVPAIMIGHPYPETIRAIRDANRVFREKGVVVVPVSRLIQKKAPQGAS